MVVSTRTRIRTRFRCENSPCTPHPSRFDQPTIFRCRICLVSKPWRACYSRACYNLSSPFSWCQINFWQALRIGPLVGAGGRARTVAGGMEREKERERERERGSERECERERDRERRILIGGTLLVVSGVPSSSLPPRRHPNLISQQVYSKSFCRRQFPHTSVNLSFIYYSEE